MDKSTSCMQELPVTGENFRPQNIRANVISFLDLPDDVLFIVFQKCAIATLGRLCRVCHKLNYLIQSDCVWLGCSDVSLLVGSSITQPSRLCLYTRRSLDSPCLKEQYRLSHNWEEKKYHERVVCRLNPRQLPWIQYTGDTLWMSTNNTIRCYRVHKGSRLREDRKYHLTLHDGKQQRNRRTYARTYPSHERQTYPTQERQTYPTHERQTYPTHERQTYPTHERQTYPSHERQTYPTHERQTYPTHQNQQYPNLMNQDVSRFVVKGNMAVSGCRDGSVYVFDCVHGSCVETMYKVHKTDAQAVDFHDRCIVSGSRDRTVKILSILQENNDNNNPVRASIDMHDRIWSVAIAPSGQCFTVGTSSCKGNPSLSVWDMERAELLFSLGNYRYGAGVLDIKYEDNNTLLTCGYDANLRMWDLRSGQCVEEWEEPYDTTLYCLQTDRNVTMVTGTARYGMIRLWDKRKRESVQEYFLSQKSPVYSVAFSTARLYAALDLSITMMDFSVLPT